MLRGGLQDASYAQILAQGWFINLPDFEVLLTSFVAGVISGHAVLDFVHAVVSLGEKFGLSAGAKYAMWGYSGSTLASEWAAELQAQYAPEMSFAGSAMGGRTPYVTRTLLAITGTAVAGIAPPANIGIFNQFSDVLATLESRLKTTGPYNAAKFLGVLHMTLFQSEFAFHDENLVQYFVNGFDDVLGPTMQPIINSDGMMGYHGVPLMPLYVYKAVNDEVSPAADTDELVDKYCGIGANILYQRNTIGGYSAEITNGHADAFAWLVSVFEGTLNTTYPTHGCTIKDVSIGISTSPL